MAGTKKRKGHPSSKKSPLERRYQIRTTDPELAKWEDHAHSKGFASAAAWLRSVGNREIELEAAAAGPKKKAA